MLSDTNLLLLHLTGFDFFTGLTKLAFVRCFFVFKCLAQLASVELQRYQKENQRIRKSYYIIQKNLNQYREHDLFLQQLIDIKKLKKTDSNLSITFHEMYLKEKIRFNRNEIFYVSNVLNNLDRKEVSRKAERYNSHLH